MVIAAYALSQLPGTAVIDDSVTKLWTRVRPGGYLLVLERGTPDGFEIVKRARESIAIKDFADECEVIAPVSHLRTPPLLPIVHPRVCMPRLGERLVPFLPAAAASKVHGIYAHAWRL